MNSDGYRHYFMRRSKETNYGLLLKILRFQVEEKVQVLIKACFVVFLTMLVRIRNSQKKDSTTALVNSLTAFRN